LLDLEQLIRGAEKKSLFTGDFNMPDIDWETGHSSARARPFVEAVEDCMMEQMVNFSTQVKGNCLDLVITNIPERVSEVFEAGRLGRSDHDMLGITLEMENKTDGPVKQTTNWKRADWPSMRADLVTVDWTSEMMGKSAEEMCSVLRQKVNETVKKHVPTRSVRGRGKSAWLTKQIIAAVRRKQRLWKKAKKGKSVEEYEAADSEVKRMIRNAKRNFEKRLAGNNGGSNRPFYAYIKRKTKSRPGIGTLKNEKKEIVTEDQGMAELLNNFFGSVFTREDAENIPVAEEMEGGILDSITITEKAVRENIRNLKTDSAAGPDEIGPKLLQELESVLTKPLTWIF
jgi:hypothetical protein